MKLFHSTSPILGNITNDKLLDDNGSVLVIPINCVLKTHQEKVNEKRESFEKMAF